MTQTTDKASELRSDICRCEEPLPVHRAERKGAAVTVCMRCGQRIPPRLR
jgi:hypothetical protein